MMEDKLERNGTAGQEKEMRTIKLTYQHKTANGDWITKEYTTSSGKDYERVVNVIHNNKEEYKVIKVEHI